MKRTFFGGLLAAAVFAAVMSFSTSQSPVVKMQDSIISTAEALDCMWAYHYGPTISGGGNYGVSIQAFTNSAYFAWQLQAAGCGGPSGPRIAVDVDLWGHGAASSNGVSSANAFWATSGTHYGLHQGSSAHFVMWYYVQASQTSVDFGWPPSGCPDGGYYDEGSGQCLSPIIIDTKKGEVKGLTSAANGVQFDIDADGVVDQVSWTKGNKKNQAFLVLDRNGNGIIDDGSELFGNYTVPGAKNGFDALAKVVNSNSDGIVDAKDPLFAELGLWTDANHDGISQPEEIQPASSIVENIGLGADIDTEKVDKNGNQFYWKGYATLKGEGKRSDREVPVYDVYLVKQ